MARSHGTGMTERNDVPVLMLAPTTGPAKGWSGGPAIWLATHAVAGVFNALVSYPEQPDRWMPQVISIARLRSFLTANGVDAATLDRGSVPATKRPEDATAAFRHLIRVVSAGFVDEWDNAEREAKALVEMRPTSPEAHRILGATLASADKQAQALLALDESRRLAPEAVPTLYQRAMALRALGRRSEAETELRRAIELDPEEHEAMLQLARVLMELDRAMEARDLLHRALKLAPNHPLIHWDLGLALSQMGNMTEGLAECKAAVDLTVDTEPLRPLRLTYARLLSQAGRVDEAEKELREAVRLDAEDAGTHLALASFLAEAGRKTEARQEAEKVLTLKPDDDVRKAAGELLRSLGPAPR